MCRDCTNSLGIAQRVCYNAHAIDSYSVSHWLIHMLADNENGCNNARDHIRAICTTEGDTLAAGGSIKSQRSSLMTTPWVRDGWRKQSS